MSASAIPSAPRAPIRESLRIAGEKVTRDRIMVAYHELYPAYGFNEHKGYGTPVHLAAIQQHGPCPIHRMTFAPIRPVQKEFFNANESLGAD